MSGQKVAKRIYRPKVLDFTMSSNQVPADAAQLSADQQLIYEKIIEVRDSATSEKYDVNEQIKQFNNDLPRVGVEFAFERGVNVSAFSSDVNNKVHIFADEVFATAVKNKITWLTRDKILVMLSSFNQTVPQQGLEILHQNIVVYRYDKNRAGSALNRLPVMFTIKEMEARPYTLSFDGMKVTLNFQVSLHYHAGDIDPENKASISRDLTVTEQFILDFSALSPDENQVFLPNVDAITQEMQIKVVNPKLYIEVSDALTNVINDSKPKASLGFIATILAWLSSLFSLGTKMSPKTFTKTQEYVLPKIDPLARNEDHTEPGIWQAIKRKLYVPRFLAAQNDTSDSKKTQKPAPKIGRN